MGLGSFSNMLVSQKAKKGIWLPISPRTTTSSPPLLGPSQRWLTLSHPSALLANNHPVAAADLPLTVTWIPSDAGCALCQDMGEREKKGIKREGPALHLLCSTSFSELGKKINLKTQTGKWKVKDTQLSVLELNS